MAKVQNSGLFNTGYNEDAGTNWYFTREGIYEIKFYENSHRVKHHHL